MNPGTWRRVLVPLDGTPVSELVLGLAAPIVNGAEEVHLLRVVSTTGAERAAKVEDATRYLERLATALAGRGARGRLVPVVRCGDPALMILEAAQPLEPDLVAMATHGQVGAAARAYGSVAGQVVRRCPSPTLVVDPLRHRPEGKGVRRILVPFDGSSAAASCLPLVARAARSFDADVDLVFVDPGGASAHLLVEPHRLELELAGVRARTEVVALGTRAVAARLVEAIERADADLVIVSTGGRAGVVQWTLGPVAEGVLRACRRPLLIRPARAPAPPGS